MFSNIVPITLDQHKNVKIKPLSHFGFAKNLHIASVMVHEFSRAAATYPVVFLEDKERDQFRPVVLMGLQPGENLFVNEEGRWKSSYVPAIIRRYPFILAKTQDADRFTVCLDADSDLVNEAEGQPLFNEKGEPTAVVENVKKYLGELQVMEKLTQDFCRTLAEKNLFTPLNMRVREDNQVKNIAGCYVINEERLNNLSDESFLALRAKRYLAPIYAHLSSLAQIERLLRFKEEAAGKQPAVLKQDDPEQTSVH